MSASTEEQLMRQIHMLGHIVRAYFPAQWSDISDYMDEDYEATLRRRTLPDRRKAHGRGVLGQILRQART